MPYFKAKLEYINRTPCKPKFADLIPAGNLVVVGFKGDTFFELLLQDFSTCLELQGKWEGPNENGQLSWYHSHFYGSQGAGILILGRMDVLLLEAGIPSSLEPDCLQEEDFLC